MPEIDKELEKRDKLYKKFAEIVREFGKSDEYDSAVLDDVIEQLYFRVLEGAAETDSEMAEEAKKRNQHYTSIYNASELDRLIKRVIAHFNITIFEIIGVLDAVAWELHRDCEEAPTSEKNDLFEKFGFKNLN